MKASKPKIKHSKSAVISLIALGIYCILAIVFSALDAALPTTNVHAQTVTEPTTIVLSTEPIEPNVENYEIVEETKKPYKYLFTTIDFYEDKTLTDPLELVVDNPVRKYRFGTRMTPSVKIYPENGVKNWTEEVDTSGFKYAGRYKITGYTPKCVHCCGSDKGICASGVEAISGYSVAAGNEFKFGTTLYIEGYGFYVVEDRGNLGQNVIDIACPDHDTCYAITHGAINVYVVPNKYDK